MNKELYELSYSLKKELQKKIFTVVLFLIGIFAFINLFLFFIAFPVRQKSISMSPDIAKESCIFFTPLNKNIQRGDVVLLESRNEEKLSNTETILNMFISFFTGRQFVLFKNYKFMGNQQQIRRVIGVPGDKIYMRDYVMYIKPEDGKYFLTEFELIKKTYNVNINAAPSLWDTSIGVEGSFDTIELGEDEYFVLGDLRNSSSDSRLWGKVEENQISAKALFTYYPFNKIKIF